MRRKPRTRLRDHVGQKIGRERVRAAKLCLQLAKAVLVFRIEQHDTISNGRDLNVRPHWKDGQGAIKKRDGRNARGIGVS
jgi:hypothetical protein